MARPGDGVRDETAPADAVTALERYTALKPRDTGALSELASQYTNLANTYATDYQNAQLEGAMAAPQTLFTPPASTTFGKIFADPKGLQDPIAALLQSQATTKLRPPTRSTSRRNRTPKRRTRRSPS